MDLVPIVAIVAGNIMIVAVVATGAAAITKGRKYKLALREQERKPSGADAAIAAKTELRLAALEQRVDVQEQQIRQLEDDNGFLHRLLEDKSKPDG